ncbi:MAG TPA: extracellular solute-binding protein [Jatrophihabitans sp.]|jgi:sulfate transport system substrate-binding protein|uniref:extracellular solute-binding protein n=1 Tax=Jatrophihabitans sp. TaxID=1932789 RepID=UPI002EFCB6ED
MTTAPGRRTGAALLAAASVLLALTGCSSSSDASADGKLSLVAYSVPKPAYEALTAAFAATEQGKGVSWASSYGASGTQSQAVGNGQKADYVAFSLEPDMTKLVPKFVEEGWNSGPTKGMVSNSVVVIAVRKGNPLHITGWDDLTKPGVKIVTPDPGSSGSAKWNILAAYSHVLAGGGTEAQAQDYLKAFFANVVSKPTSGANATSTFLNGTGDVLLSYENEAIAARQKGQSLDYLVPAESILIENPAAVTKTAPQQAKDFLAYVQSADGQKVFAGKGYRPVIKDVPVGAVTGANDPANPFPAVAKLQTIADLGGWSAVNKKYFDKNAGIVTRIMAGKGG